MIGAILASVSPDSSAPCVHDGSSGGPKIETSGNLERFRHVGGYVFVSHATEDRTIAEALVAALEANGRPCWIAARDIPVGANFAKEIVNGVKNSGAAVVILSRKAIDSPHVRREVSLAIDLGKDVFPLSLEPSIRGAADLPGDWSYWLSLVQIHAFASPMRAASIVQSRLISSGEEAARKSDTAREQGEDSTPSAVIASQSVVPAPQADRRGTPNMDDRVRSALIQVGVSGLTFEIAVERGRRLGASPDDVAGVAYRLRDGHLLSFDGDLAPSTVIRLT